MTCKATISELRRRDFLTVSAAISAGAAMFNSADLAEARPISWRNIDENFKPCVDMRKGKNPTDGAAHGLMSPTLKKQTEHAPSDSPARAPTPSARMAVLSKWEKKLLTVNFLSGSAEVRREVANIIESNWVKYALMDFKWDVPARDADIRILFDATMGNQSFIGVQIPNEVVEDSSKFTMSIGLRSNDIDRLRLPEYRGIVLHEFGHALGCIHEHSSPAASIDFNENAILSELSQTQTPPWNLQMVRDNIIKRYQGSDLKMFSTFDPRSIMIYAIPPNWTNDGFSVDPNTSLSSTDIRYISKLYPGRYTAPEDKGTTETEAAGTSTSSNKLTLNGDKVSSEAGSVRERTFDFENTERSDVTISARGSMPVKMILKSDSGEVKTRARVTEDLSSEIQYFQDLPKGKYQITVRPYHDDARYLREFTLKAEAGKKLPAYFLPSSDR